MNVLSRFSNRVANYVTYRPGYPRELVLFLKNSGIIGDNTIIADIGSGTGISAKLFLDEGCIVYGIEPNKEMREAGESYLSEYSTFHSIDATAEDTRLEKHSIDSIIIAQAFHWFDQSKCNVEFKRILKPGGHIVLIWNDRITDSSDFLKAYEKLLIDFSIDYREVNHKNIDENRILDFFSFFVPEIKSIPFRSKFGTSYGESWKGANYQIFDYEGLEGRLLSSSYVPMAGHPNYEPMIIELKSIFDLYNENGKVKFEYNTIAYTIKVE